MASLSHSLASISLSPTGSCAGMVMEARSVGEGAGRRLTAGRGATWAQIAAVGVTAADVARVRDSPGERVVPGIGTGVGACLSMVRIRTIS